MTKFIIHRIIGIIPTLFVVITISFFLIRLAPGGPFDLEKQLPKIIIENMQKKYHMDDPLWKQYGRYLLDVIQLDFGASYRYQDHDVNYFIGKSLPNSMLLGSIALTLAVFLGVVTGIISALKQNTWADYSSMSIAVIGISVPNFVVGPVLMYYLALKFHLLPTSGWITDPAGWRTLIMPVFTLSLGLFAVIARLSRSSLLEVIRSDYIRTARAKGLSGPVIIFKHALKGAMLPVVSYLGPAFANVLTGAVVVERIFRVPGIANFFVQSAFNRDYTLVMGTLIVYSFILILMNFIVDIAYGFLDPRIAYK
jgi:oligopeptide transport system permease protein